MAELFRSLLKVFGSLFPPAMNDRDAEVRWQWTISTSVVALLVALVVNVAIAYGMVPPLWYAPESQIQGIMSTVTRLSVQTRDVASDVDMTLKLDLGKELRDNQSNRCTASASSQKINLSNIIDTEQQYYYKRFGVYYQLPDCSQL